MKEFCIVYTDSETQKVFQTVLTYAQQDMLWKD